MQTTTTLFLLSILFVGALAATTTPIPPFLPYRFLAVGSFVSLDKDSSVKGYGKFNMKYDWNNRVMRSDSVLFPEGNTYNISYVAAWNSPQKNTLAFFGKDNAQVNCFESSHATKIPSPTFLQELCKFKGRDASLERLVNVWDCDAGIDIMAWTDVADGKLTKVMVEYPHANVVMEFTSFIEVEEFDKDLFTPPKAWNCTGDYKL